MGGKRRSGARRWRRGRRRHPQSSHSPECTPVNSTATFPVEAVNPIMQSMAAPFSHTTWLAHTRIQYTHVYTPIYYKYLWKQLQLSLGLSPHPLPGWSITATTCAAGVWKFLQLIKACNHQDLHTQPDTSKPRCCVLLARPTAVNLPFKCLNKHFEHPRCPFFLLCLSLVPVIRFFHYRFVYSCVSFFLFLMWAHVSLQLLLIALYDL